MRRRRPALAVALVATLALSGCGLDLSLQGAAGGQDGVVRFTFAPDPVWDWLNDEGILQEMERESGISIEASSTWDEFGIFAGGHADVVSAASYEIPTIEEETGRETLTIGKYNVDRSVIITRADNPAETLADLQGEEVSVFTAVSATLVWGAYAREMHDLDFRTGGGDFDLIVADPQNQPDLVARGEVAACVCLPEFAMPGLRTGELKIINDGRASSDVFQDVVDPEHQGPMINVFLAGREWAEENPEEVDFFLDVWQRGLQEWDAHQAEIIAAYPQHFAVEDPADVAYVTDYVAEHDWFVDDVRVDPEWAQGEIGVFDLLKRNDFMDQEQANPAFVEGAGS